MMRQIAARVRLHLEANRLAAFRANWRWVAGQHVTWSDRRCLRRQARAELAALRGIPRGRRG